MKTLQHAKGIMHDLTVTRRGKTVTLWAKPGVRQSVFDVAAPHQPGLEYARNMLAALLFCPNAQSCLMLGLGGASIPRMLLLAQPQMKVDAVEIEPAAVEMAARHFDTGGLSRMTVYLEDAANYVQRCTRRYGIIAIDTYVGERFPDHCATREFFGNVKNCLLKDGVVAINLLMDHLSIRRNVADGLKSIMGQIWQLSCLESRNVLYFGVQGNRTRQEIQAAATNSNLPFENSLPQLANRIKLAE